MKNKLPKILLVDDESELRELIAMGFRSRFQVEILEAGSTQEAIRIIEETSDIDLIVSDYAMPLGNGSLILDKLDEAKIKIPFVFFTSYFANQIDPKDLDRAEALITKPSLDGSLNRYVGDILKRLKALNPTAGHIRVRRDWVTAMPRAFADYYIKLAEDHYVLFVKRGTPESDESFQRLQEKEEEFIWVKADEGESLISAMIQRLDLDPLKNAETWESEVEWAEKVSQIAHSFYEGMGWSKEVEELATKNLRQVEKKMQELPRLRDLLERIKTNGAHYLYHHASVLAYISIGLLKELKVLTNYGADEVQALTAAAIIHDIALNEEVVDRRLTYRKAFLENKKMDDDNLQLYKEHSELAAHVAAAWKGVDEGVEEIVIHHHERPDGKGFPFALPADEIPALCCVFIFSHDLAEYALTQSPGVDFSNFCEERKNLYSTGLFKDIMDKLRESLKN